VLKPLNRETSLSFLYSRCLGCINTRLCAKLYHYNISEQTAPITKRYYCHFHYFNTACAWHVLESTRKYSQSFDTSLRGNRK